MPEKSKWKSYKSFVVEIEPGQEGYYRVDAQGPAGEAESQFRLPFDEQTVSLFFGHLDKTRAAAGDPAQPETMQPAAEFGQRLYRAVFSGPVRDIYVSALHDAEQGDYGLRVQLRLRDAPALAGLPWEYLHDGRDFLALSATTPLVRYHELPDPPRRMLTELPLRILVTISSPTDLPPLDVMSEEQNVRKSLASLTNKGDVQLNFTSDATLNTLLRVLRQARSSGKPYHVWHYIGHGDFQAASQASLLMMVNDSGAAYPARGFQLGTMFNSYPEVRLALLNACQGARASHDNPLAGVAGALVERGISAVIGMQANITDQAAITFASEFYAALVDGLQIDAALTEARRAIFFQPNWIEWATPVLFMRVEDGRLFDLRPSGSLSKEELRRAMSAPTQVRAAVRPQGTTFLGKAVDAVIAGLTGKGGQKPAKSPESEGKPTGLKFAPMPHLPAPGDSHLLKKPWRLQLDIYTPTQQASLGIDLFGEMILGRSLSHPGKPLIDLDPYGAKDLGVSRQHVVIRASADGLAAIDQGSTNGTMVNDHRCAHGEVVTLTDGDVLRMSKIAVVVRVIQHP